MILSRNLNGSAKIVFKVKFQGNFSVSIDLVSINKDYVKRKYENDYMYYKNETYNFVLWSTQNFIFDNRQIRLPDESNIKENMSHVHVFSSDKERYATLKKMYNTLNEWSKTDDIIKGLSIGERKRVILAGDYWFVS
jgi:ABC-type multidrug transport system ATPase subunit